MRTVAVGALYERSVARTLGAYQFSLRARGGPHDGGVDLVGMWQLRASSVPVLVQCKRTQRRVGPRDVRELEGVVMRRSTGTLGLLVSSSGFTRYGLEAAMRASVPLVLATMPMDVPTSSEHHDHACEGREAGVPPDERAHTPTLASFVVNGNAWRNLPSLRIATDAGGNLVLRDGVDALGPPRH